MVLVKKGYQRRFFYFILGVAVFFFIFLTQRIDAKAYGQVFNANGYSIQTNYEITQFNVSGGNIHIYGWAMARKYQNFQSTPNSHSYSLTINGVNKTFYDVNDYYVSVTKGFDDVGQGYCTGITGQPGVGSACDFYYEDVGFHFIIPLTDFNSAIQNGQRDFYFILNMQCKNSRAGYYNFSQFIYASKSMLNNGNGIAVSFGDGYQGKISGSLESKSMYCTIPNGYVRTGPSKSYGVLRISGRYMYWGEGWSYNNISLAGRSDSVGWYNLWVSDSGRSVNGRRRVSNGGGYLGYIQSGFFNFSDFGQNPAMLHVDITNKAPEIVSTTMQTYYSGQKLTTDMVKSGLVIKDKEDGYFVLNGPSNKISVTLSSSEIGISGNTINTTNVTGIKNVKITATDSQGAQVSGTVQLKFIKNTAPTIENITEGEERILYIRSYNLKSKDMLENIISKDNEDGDLTDFLKIYKSGVEYDDGIDRNIPARYEDFSVRITDIPLFDVANHNVTQTSNTTTTGTFEVSGGRNYQISVPTSMYRVYEYGANGNLLRDSGYIKNTTGEYANTYTMQSSTSYIKLELNGININPENIHCVRDVWAQNVALTTIVNFIQNILDYYPPELTSHDYYYFVGYELTPEELMQDIVITDSRFDVNKIRETLKLTNFEVVDVNTPGDYVVQATATNDGIEENPDLAVEKYTGTLNLNVHIIDTDDTQFIKKQIRYINSKYIGTLSEDSNWFKTDNLLTKLQDALDKEATDENIVVSYKFTGKEIADLKEYIRKKKPTDIFTADFNKLFYSKLKNYEKINNMSSSWIKLDDEHWGYQHFNDGKAELVKNKWESIEGLSYYFDENGFMVQNRWYQIGDLTYYFTAEGSLAKGWTYINGGYYYFDDEYQKVTGFYTIDGNIYYFNEAGVRATGWESINGTQFYFGNNGIMLHGGIFKVNGTEYIFNDDGSIPYYFVEYKGYLYFVDPVKGIIKGQTYDYNGNKYLFDDSGHALKGWQEINGHIYFINDDYTVVYNQFMTIDGEIYYFDENGYILTTEGIINIDGASYYIQSNGTILRDSWKTIAGEKYYFGSNGVAAVGVIQIDNLYYYFNEKGIMQKNTWYQDYYFGEKGEAVNGWLELIEIEEHISYEFDEEGNKIETVEKVEALHKYYLENYKAIKDEIKAIDEHRYYFNSDGILTSGFINHKDNLYYFDDNYEMVTNKLFVVAGNYYYFGDDGAAITSQWKTIDGVKYYFNSNHLMARGETVFIENNYYHFEDDGSLSKEAIYNGMYFDEEGIGESLLRVYTITAPVYETDEDGNIIYDDEGQPILGESSYDVTAGLTEKGQLIITGKGDTVIFNDSIEVPWLTDTVLDENNNSIKVSDFISSVEFKTGYNNDLQITNMDYWFKDCINLETVNTVPNTLTSINSTFEGCLNLTYVPSLRNTKIQTMNRAFANASNIPEIPELPDTVVNADYAFVNAYAITSVNSLPDSLQSMIGMFQNCYSLTSVEELPSQVEYMDMAFENAYNLKTVNAVIGSKVKTARYTFAGCSLLETAPVLGELLEDTTGMFMDCEMLTGDLVVLHVASDQDIYTDMFTNAATSQVSQLNVYVIDNNYGNKISSIIDSSSHITVKQWVPKNYSINLTSGTMDVQVSNGIAYMTMPNGKILDATVSHPEIDNFETNGSIKYVIIKNYSAEKVKGNIADVFNNLAQLKKLVLY